MEARAVNYHRGSSRDQTIRRHVASCLQVFWRYGVPGMTLAFHIRRDLVVKCWVRSEGNRCRDRHAHRRTTPCTMTKKYPSTPYWPYSPTPGQGTVAVQTSRFVDREVVITEKLDGGNTLLHGGQVYSRSVSEPSDGKWMAMVKKHHAWKIQEPDIFLYGEDIYAVHSIEYEPVAEDRTFYAFALRNGKDEFASFADLERYAQERAIPVVPVLFRGRFQSVAAIRRFIVSAHSKPSVLGGEREGVVLRVAEAFPSADFAKNVCKSVRSNHVQTTTDWRRSWRPCRTMPVAG